MIREWLSGILGAAPRDRAAGDDFWFSSDPGLVTAAGQIVTPLTALRVPAVVDALSAITQPLAHLPLKVFRRTGPDDKEPAPDHPAAALLQAPSVSGMTRYEWRGQAQWELALHANAYAEWVFGLDGAEGWRLHDPMLVRPDTQGGRRVYWVPDSGGMRRVAADMMWHLRTLPLDRDRLCGISPVAQNADTIAHALAVQAYGQRYFANDGQQGGIIEMDRPFKTPEDRDKFLAAWRRASTGRSAHRDRILDNGGKYNRAQINNQHSQFLETRREMAIEVARIWHVPPHKLRSLDRATHSNIEQQSLEFVTDTLLPWFSLWEASIKQHVIDPMSEASGLDADEYFAEFNAAGLLRGDLKSRYQAFAVGRNWGWLSVNDIRRLENMPPVQDGDVYLQPTNMGVAGDPPEDDDDKGGGSAPPRDETE